MSYGMRCAFDLLKTELCLYQFRCLFIVIECDYAPWVEWMLNDGDGIKIWNEDIQ